MFIRVMLFALALLPLPAAAQETESDEALVMRLIFDDCMPYVQDGHEPFVGLETTAPTAEEMAELELFIGQGLSAASIRDRTYHAMWRIAEGQRTCMVAITDLALQKTVLTIHPTEFVEQVTVRAKEAGLVMADLPAGVKTSDPRWFESGVPPGDGVTIKLGFGPMEDLAKVELIWVTMPVATAIN